jgi:hypothetical protein
VLDWRGIELIGQAQKNSFALSAIVVEDADFDQAVGLEGRVDFFLNGGGQTVAANQNHRVEVVGVGSVHFALCGREDDLGHGTIILYR